jgi:multidrug efflux pump subunit AcrA (membrane-fusion protein)
VVGDDSRIRHQPIELGVQNEQMVEVTGGLQQGQTIAVSNVTDLRDGDLVAGRADAPITAGGPPTDN